MIKQHAANIVLWLAYCLALVASLNHVAWAFSTLEFVGHAWTGWLAALAVDAGLAALAYAIQQRRRAKRPIWTLWLGIGLFASISAFANLLHALTVQVDGAAITLSTFGQVDTLTLAKAIILSATLPLLVVYLGEVVSGDDAEASKLAEHERKQSERRDRRAVQVDSDRTASVQVESSNSPSNGQIETSISSTTPVLDAINTTRQASRVEKMEALLVYVEENPDTPLGQIGQAIGVSKSCAGNYVKELEKSGRLKRNGQGWEVTG